MRGALESVNREIRVVMSLNRLIPVGGKKSAPLQLPIWRQATPAAFAAASTPSRRSESRLVMALPPPPRYDFARVGVQRREPDMQQLRLI